jgi:hypothetical protein
MEHNHAGTVADAPHDRNGRATGRPAMNSAIAAARWNRTVSPYCAS